MIPTLLGRKEQIKKLEQGFHPEDWDVTKNTVEAKIRYQHKTYALGFELTPETINDEKYLDYLNFATKQTLKQLRR